jgi:hypothetical protein
MAQERQEVQEVQEIQRVELALSSRSYPVPAPQDRH